MATRSMNLWNLLDDLQLVRTGSQSECGLIVTSLPCPRTKGGPLTVAGRVTHNQSLGQWPDEPKGSPRRALLLADGLNDAPSRLNVSRGSLVTPEFAPPTAEAELFEKCEETAMMWERHMLRLRWGGASLGIAMGLRHAGQVHWWECCRLVVIEQTPECTTIEMGGAIPRTLFGQAELEKYTGFVNPFVHHHNWINGHLYARLHANGVCEVFAHHINAKFFDDGLPLDDVVPVIGFVSDNPGLDAAHTGSWTGQQTAIDLSSARLDLSEVSRLARPDSPGSLTHDGRFLVLQPYEGVELFSGGYSRAVHNDPFLFRAKDRHFPRGMSRTLRFTLSLNPARSPRVARYLAPAWWYGLCEEFTPAPLLPVMNRYDRRLDDARQFVRQHIVRGGFEDGAIPREAKGPPPQPSDCGRYEAGWEGESPYSQFLMAWRSGDGQDYDNALRCAYYFTDVCVDHAAKLVRMHGYEPNAISLPMSRVQGTLAAWLETGDPYLLDTAMAVVDTSHWVQKNSWPRLAVGRDAKYLRSAVMLYRYTGDAHYQKLAHEGAMMVVHSQRPNGSFGDQAGGTGIHQRAAYVTKPWMGSMCTEGVMDYIEYCEADPALVRTIVRWADWLMDNRWKHANGITGWSYQHDFNGQKRHYVAQAGKWMDLPTPDHWYSDSVARVMTFCASIDGDTSRIDAWAESLEAAGRVLSDHGLAAVGQGMTWITARLWNAKLDDAGLSITPMYFGRRTPDSAQILTPQGPMDVSWDTDGRVVVPEHVRVIPPSLLALPAVGSGACK